MRRILMFMGIAILAFPMVAVGAVKVRTKTGGHKWDFPAGKARVKGFKAPVKAGPFTLGFSTQIEMDFNSNHQFDFSDDVADGQANNGVGGVGGINTVVGLAVPGDDQKGDEFIHEIRFGMDAVAGPMTTHIVLEKVGNIVSDTNSEAAGLQVERAWGDVDLGWFNVRYGLELYAIEPTYMLYGDDDYMLSIYKNTGDFAWRISYMKRNDGDPDSGIGNVVTALTPGASNASAAGEGTNNDTDIVMVFIEIPFANPLGPGTMSVQPFYVLDHDKRFKVPEITLADGSEFDGEIISHYLGATIITNLGPVKAVISGAYNFGTDNTGFNGVSATTGLARDDVDISAWQAYALLAYPVPGIPLTVEAGAYLASGDDDPFDDSANGWLGVTHNSEMFGGNDLFISKTEDGSQMTVRLESAAGVANAGPSVGLSNDDEAILQGLSNFNNVANAAGFHPTRGAAAIGPTPGSNTNGGDPYAVNNRSHPGIAIAHVGLNYKLLKNATVTASYEHIRLMQTDGFSPLAAGRTAVPGAAGLTQGGSIDGHFGDQFGIGAKWSPVKYVTIEPGFNVLFPGDAVEDLTGSDDTAWQIRLGMRWAF